MANTGTPDRRCAACGRDLPAQHGRGRIRQGQDRGHLKAVGVTQAYVEEDRIGRQPVGQPERGVGAVGLADHRVAAALEQVAGHPPKRTRSVDDQYADRCCCPGHAFIVARPEDHVDRAFG